ncbi:MAG: hypothetical protein M1824_004845 [Vezdaea acicularis]|nr:MAG: hypothetical protein M1824_004845 [Vezdaea acicularis]
MDEEAKAWRNVYEFDTPVVHFEKSSRPTDSQEIALKARKLMHRFSEAEVERILDQVETDA